MFTHINLPTSGECASTPNGRANRRESGGSYLRRESILPAEPTGPKGREPGSAIYYLAGATDVNVLYNSDRDGDAVMIESSHQ